MKQVSRALATLILAMVATGAQAEVTGNIGWMSNYLFRGIPLASSSAMFGVDWNQDPDRGGFYAGAWAANVDPGAEIDLYGGYTGQVSDFDYTVGGTYYSFTDAFDENALELNLAGTWKFLTLEANFGKYDSQPKQNFTYLAATAEHNGFYGLIGSWGKDFDGEFVRAGYQTEFMTLDIDVFYNYSNSELVEFFGAGTGSDTSIVLTVSKTFSFSQASAAFTGKE